MTILDTLGADLLGIDDNWIKKNYEMIVNHPAWNGEISELEASQMLQGKEVFTYVLRPADKERSYFISFVNQDHFVQHQYFTLELGLKGWHYKNGVVVPPAKNIDDLIPKMMHCHPNELKILNQMCF